MESGIKKVVFNADDFGVTDGVCRGILKAFDRGIVRSTTMLTCSPGALARLAEYAPDLNGKAGVHLQLTFGKPRLPASRVPSLVDGEGRFPSKSRDVGEVDPEEVYREWKAQIESVLALGVSPTHVDSHHHIHSLPGVFPVFVRIAREFGLAARAVGRAEAARLREAGVPCPDTCVTGWFREDLSREWLLRLLDSAFMLCGDDAVVEVMCHPGEVTPDLNGLSTYVDERAVELAELTSSGLARELAARGIEPAGVAAVESGPGAKK